MILIVKPIWTALSRHFLGKALDNLLPPREDNNWSNPNFLDRNSTMGRVVRYIHLWVESFLFHNYDLPCCELFASEANPYTTLDRLTGVRPE